MNIDRDELRKYLRDNLRLSKNENTGYYGEHSYTIALTLEGKEIDSVTIDMPNTDNQSRWQSSSC